MAKNPHDLAAHIRKVFGRYADAPIWVAWEARPNPNPDKDVIKIPINPVTGFPASSTDPKTWAPMGQALAACGRRGLAGIGVMLGPDPDQNPEGSPDRPFLVGVDYDNALKPDGTLTDWAQKNWLENTYAEISPSGTGVKAFAVIAGRPDGLPQGQDGVTLKLGELVPATDNGKRPGIEVYTARRWFAVTGETFGITEKIADMTARIPVLLRNAPPMPAVTPPAIPSDPDSSFTAQDARDAHATALTDTERSSLSATVNMHPDFAKAMVGAEWQDRSMALFAAADLAKGHKLTFGQFVHGIMAATGSAGEHVRQQPDPYRALARAWDRSPTPIPMASPGPVPEGAQIGDRPGVSTSGLDGYLTPGVAPDLSWLEEVNPLGAPYTLPLDLFTNPPELPRFVLPGMFPAAPTALVGTGGVLKSTIWMSMALNMILDRPQWGRVWYEGQSALMLSKEDERPIMLRRLHDLLHGMNVTQRQYQEIVARRFYLDDMTESAARLVESDGKGNLITTPTAGYLIDKYEGRNIGFAAIDPMVNFGPGEAHGNDGAALMMQIGWRLTRGWAGTNGRTSLTYIHHISVNNAREEIDDQHAGRGASALGDNARSVWVLHRHKQVNPNRHVAPSSIPIDAIERGDVIRMKMAKNSYARRVEEPFWAWREGDAIHFVEPMDATEARIASARVPTPTEQAAEDRRTAARLSLRDWIRQQTDGFTRPQFDAAARSNRITANDASALFDTGVADGLFVRMAGPAERYVSPTATPQTDYGF